MFTYKFRVDLGSYHGTITVRAKDYATASNHIHNRFPPAAIISPVQ